MITLLVKPLIPEADLVSQSAPFWILQQPKIRPFDTTDDLSIGRIIDKYKNHPDIITVKQFCKENFLFSFQFLERDFVLNKKRSLDATKSAQEIDKIIK